MERQEIQDTGTVWVKGNSGTSFAVRVGETIFVLGGEEGPQLNYWLDHDALCVDWHPESKENRTALRFSTQLKPTHPASPFRGFTQTHHADTRVVLPTDPGVEEFICSGEDYRNNRVGELSSEEFFRLAGFQ